MIFNCGFRLMIGEFISRLIINLEQIGKKMLFLDNDKMLQFIHLKPVFKKILLKNIMINECIFLHGKMHANAVEQ